MAAHRPSDFDEAQFRREYEIDLARSGLTYEQCRLAYLLGRELGSDRRYRGNDWKRIEPQARQIWERRLPGTWEKIKETAQQAFEQAQAIS